MAGRRLPRPMTLAQIRKAAARRVLRKNTLSEVDIVYFQDESNIFRCTVLLTGDAVRKGLLGDEHIGGFLFSNEKQSNGEILHLAGMMKRLGETTWTPCWIQVCNGNDLAMGGCASSVMVYDAALFPKSKERKPNSKAGANNPPKHSTSGRA